jgi:hypothetical protein
MRRAVAEILDPSPGSVDEVWEYFDSRCAYCGKPLSREGREGHLDHAEVGGGNHMGNLVLACGTCNGDEKRERGWREFLRVKASGTELAQREAQILGWFERHPAPTGRDSADVLRVRAELDALIDAFGVKCAELKNAVRRERSGHVASATPKRARTSTPP